MTTTLHRSLKEAGLKNTPTRELILNIFSTDCKPINAEYIYQKSKSKKVNRVTIYRTLTSLEHSHIIRKIDLRKGSVYYELTDHHHHHLICRSCDKTESFDGCEIDTLSNGIMKKSLLFDSIDEHSFELFGLCKLCAKTDR